MRKWKILDFGSVPENAPPKLEFTCTNCMRDALLPVVGRPIAQISSGIVFDIGDYAIPKKIRCPHCRKGMEKEG